MEALEGKTVVLVTHQVEFLPAVDSILVRELFHVAFFMLIQTIYEKSSNGLIES